MKAKIFYGKFFDADENEFVVGGVQVYLHDLCKVLENNGFEWEFWQFSNREFRAKVGNGTIFGCRIKGLTPGARKRKLVQVGMGHNPNKDDLIIFGSEEFFVKTDRKNVLIQHGISWDLPIKSKKNGKNIFLLQLAKKIAKTIKYISICRKASNIVCVDYNFPNWLRSFSWFDGALKIRVIPNYAKGWGEFKKGHVLKKEKNYIKILFPRRFFPYRGTREMCYVGERVLKKYDNVKIFFSGIGPDDYYIVEKFKGEKRVKVFNYRMEDRMGILGRYDIVVVPSLGSEGTPLVIAEAMSSGCAVIASHVGGIPNMVIDGFNGVLFPPGNKHEFLDCLCKIIEDEAFRRKIILNGKKTFEASFTFKRWEEKWAKMLRSIYIG